MRPTPRSITWLAILLPAAAAVGVAEFAIGIYQATWLSANKSAALAAATEYDIYRAVSNLESSAHMSLIAGGAATLLVVGRFLVRKAVPFARLVLWILWSAALLGTLLLVGDSSIGLTAYVDDVHRRALSIRRHTRVPQNPQGTGIGLQLGHSPDVTAQPTRPGQHAPMTS
jgi:hypothetical protein